MQHLFEKVFRKLGGSSLYILLVTNIYDKFHTLHHLQPIQNTWVPHRKNNTVCNSLQRGLIDHKGKGGGGACFPMYHP